MGGSTYREMLSVQPSSLTSSNATTRARSSTQLYTTGLDSIHYLAPWFLTAAPANLMIYSLLPPQEQEAFGFMFWAYAASLTGCLLFLFYLGASALFFRNHTRVTISKADIEAERRGASRVLAVDSYAWDGRNWSNKDGFELARRALGSRVEDKQVEVLDISPQRVGEFDLVLFLGVLYHMRYPLLALERVASVTKEQLILETHVDLLGCGSAAMAFYPGKQLDGDSTNWWGPNTRAMEAMLKTVGFRRIELVTPPSLLRRLTHLVGRGHPRAVYHAWK